MANGETPNPVLGVQVPPPLKEIMNPVQSVRKFFGEFKAELSKVSWSTRDELTGATVVVITLTAILTVFIFCVDFALAKMLQVIFR